jgi:tight adherence protein C
MTAVIVLGTLLALGLLQLRWLLFPPAPDLVAEIDQWRRGRQRATERVGGSQTLSPLGRLTRWVVDTLRTYQPEFLDNLAPDLAITQRDLQSWLTRVTGLALGFGLAPIVLVLGRRLRGDDVSVQWAPVVGVVLAVAAVMLSIKDLRAQAARAREEFNDALSEFLDWVAMSMEAGQGHAQALPAASQIGTLRVFDEIRTAIDLAPSRGITAWEALGQMGERYRIAELISLRSSIELAQDDGARVKASLIARAKTMRASRLAGAVERANKATESMRQLTMVAAMLAAVYIAAPYILALRSAAGAP